MAYFYVDPKTGAPTTRPPSFGRSGGDMGGLDFGQSFSFDAQMPEAPSVSIDFDKEAYRESIVAPAEQARKDATLEAVQQARATAAMTGRPSGDIESKILQGSVRQAGATSAAASQAAEEAGLKAEVSEAQLAMEQYRVDVQKAVAQQELKVKAWSLMEQIKADYTKLRMLQNHERTLLHDRLGFEAGEAEANRRHDMELKMFELQSGMSMLKFKEENANLRTMAGFAQDERESLRDHSYKMQYLDSWRQLEGMKTLYDWRSTFGRASLYTRPKAARTEPGQPNEMDYGKNWWEISPETEGYNPWANLVMP